MDPKWANFKWETRRQRNIRDHKLIVHAVVNEAIESKTKIDLQFTDIKQCFDSLWLQEATNDLYDSGLTSRNLNIIYEGNRQTQMCVETNFGRSGRTELKDHSRVWVCTEKGGQISERLKKRCTICPPGGQISDRLENGGQIRHRFVVHLKWWANW